MTTSSSSITRSVSSSWLWFERLSKVLTLAIIPVLLWAIRVEIFMSQGPRFTPDDAKLLRAEIVYEIDQSLDQQPPEAFKTKVEEIRDLAIANNKEIQGMKLDLAHIRGDISAIRLILDSD